MRKLLTMLVVIISFSWLVAYALPAKGAEVNRPVPTPGDFWEYESSVSLSFMTDPGNYAAEIEGTIRVEMVAYETLTLAGVDTPTLKMKGNVSLALTMQIPGPLGAPLTLSGTIVANSTDYRRTSDFELVYSESSGEVTTTMTVFGFPVTGTSTFQGNTTTKVLSSDFAFPLTYPCSGKTKLNTTTEATYTVSLFGTTTTNHSSTSLETESAFHCLMEKNVTVPAGQFLTVPLSRKTSGLGGVDFATLGIPNPAGNFTSREYWSEEAGSFVKQETRNETDSVVAENVLVKYRYRPYKPGPASLLDRELYGVKFSTILLTVGLIVPLVVALALIFWWKSRPRTPTFAPGVPPGTAGSGPMPPQNPR